MLKRSAVSRHPSSTLFFLLYIASYTITSFAFEGEPDHYFDLSLEELEDVIVTSTKRESNVHTTPVSISVFSAKELQDRSIESLNDLSGITASYQSFASDDTESAPLMRGVYGSGAGFQGSPSVAFYMDETALTSTARGQGEFLLADVKRLEILRGPQGSLFGDGSLAGTVRIITHKPDLHDASAKIKAGMNRLHGGSDGNSLQGVFNLPLIQEKLALRLVASDKEHSGWLDNSQQNKNDVNPLEDSQARLALRYQALENLTLDFNYMYQDLENLNTHDAPLNGQKPSILDESETLQNDTYSFTLTYIMDWSEVVFASSKSERQDRAVVDATLGFNTVLAPVFNVVPIVSDTALDVTSHEFRLVSAESDTLEWTSGIFYKRFDRSLRQFTDADPTPDTAMGNSAFTGRKLVNAFLTYDLEQTSLFGELTWHINNEFDLMLGGQYFEEKRKGTLSDDGIFAATTITGERQNAKSDAFSPRLVGAWKSSPEAYYFASVSQGFRAGGVNSPATLINLVTPGLASPTVEPETITSYELGAKYKLKDLSANFALYHQNWEDIQLTLRSPARIFYLENAGEVATDGFEFDVNYALNRQISFFFSGAYTRSEFDKQVFSPSGSEIFKKGNKVQHIPEWAWSASANYTFNLTNYPAMARVDYIYRDETYSDAKNTPETKNDALNTLNIRIGIEEKQWQAYLFIKNLLNNNNTVSKTQSEVDIYATYERPLFAGLEFQYHFQ